MKLKEIVLLLTNASDEGIEKLLLENGIVKDFLSKADAYRIYGRSNIDRWLTENLIQISDKRISRSELEAIAAASNRVTYLPVAER